MFSARAPKKSANRKPSRTTKLGRRANEEAPPTSRSERRSGGYFDRANELNQVFSLARSFHTHTLFGRLNGAAAAGDSLGIPAERVCLPDCLSVRLFVRIIGLVLLEVGNDEGELPAFALASGFISEAVNCAPSRSANSLRQDKTRPSCFLTGCASSVNAHLSGGQLGRTWPAFAPTEFAQSALSTGNSFFSFLVVALL